MNEGDISDCVDCGDRTCQEGGVDRRETHTYMTNTCGNDSRHVSCLCVSNDTADQVS